MGKSLTSFRRPWWPVGAALVLAVIPICVHLDPVHAQSAWGALQRDDAAEQAARRAEEEEARKLGESIIGLREALGGRALDPGFRETVKRQLLGVPIDALRDFERDGGRGDLRAAIAGASTGGDGEDLLLLPAQTAGPAAVSGVAQTGSVFVPVAPCRIVDTRIAGGLLVPGTPRSFVASGSSAALFGAQGGNTSGCGIPAGAATAAFVNVVAVNPVGPGHLQAWAYAAPPPPPPFSAIINYSAFNVANGITVPLCDPLATTCSYDFLVQANVSAVHLVADVLGYFRPPPTSFVSTGAAASLVAIGTTCTHYSGALVGVDVPAPGKVLVEANVQVEINHTQNAHASVAVFIGASPTTCTGSVGDYSYLTMNPQPSGYYYPETRASRLFMVTAPGTYYYYVNGTASSAGPVKFWKAGVKAIYFPN